MTPHETLQEMPPIVAARALLDDALVSMRRVASEDLSREAVTEGLGEAMRCVYLALSSLDDARAFLDARARAAATLGDVLGALQNPAIEDPAVDDVIAVTARAMRLLVGASMPMLDPPPSLPHAGERKPELRASIGVPARFDLTREVMRPMVPLPEPEPLDDLDRETDVPPPPVEDLDALRAEGRAALAAIDAADDDAPDDEDEEEAPSPWDPARAEAAAFGEQLTAMDVLFERARGCLEDLGAFGRARRPMEGEAWWAPRTEARLLTRLDALAACGYGVIPWLVRLLEERPVPDAEYTWAALMLFGSIEGDDAVDQAMRIARVTPVDDEDLRDTLADAFTHAANPRLAERLWPWLDDARPGRRIVALTALGRRGALSVDALDAHLQDADAAVVRAAVEALEHAPGEIRSPLLQGILHHPDEGVLTAALDLAAGLGSGLALARAESLVREGTPDLGDAAMHVAIASGDEGLARLHGPEGLSEVRCEALGWYGHAASVGVLLHALDVGAEPVKARAAEALWRITGAPLSDSDPAPELDEEPFGDTRWADDELPEAPDELSVKRSVWEAWWTPRAPRVDASVRWRFGRAWRLCDVVRGLAARSARPRDRRWSALELSARTGVRRPFDAWRFIPEQLAQIEAWRSSTRDPASGWTARGGWR